MPVALCPGTWQSAVLPRITRCYTTLQAKNHLPDPYFRHIRTNLPISTQSASASEPALLNSQNHKTATPNTRSSPTEAKSSSKVSPHFNKFEGSLPCSQKPAPAPVRSYINPVHTHHNPAWKADLVLYFHLCLDLPNVFSWGFPTKTQYAPLRHTCHTPRPSQFSWSGNPNNIWCGVQMNHSTTPTAAWSSHTHTHKTSNVPKTSMKHVTLKSLTLKPFTHVTKCR